MNDYQFGNFIYELRTAKGLSQEELGAMLGVSNKAVSKWENGAAKPRTALLYQLAEILDTNVEELLAGKRTQPSTPTPHAYLSDAVGRYHRTRRLATVFAWLVLLLPILLILCTALLSNNDTAGPLITVPLLLGWLASVVCTVIHRVSARRQKHALFRVFKDDLCDLERLLRKDASPEQMIQRFQMQTRLSRICLIALVSLPFFLFSAISTLLSLDTYLRGALDSDFWGPFCLLVTLLCALILLTGCLLTRHAAMRIRKSFLHHFPTHADVWNSYTQPELSSFEAALQRRRNQDFRGGFCVLLCLNLPMSFLLLITALNGGAPDPDLATLLFLFVYFPLLLNFLLVGMGVSLIEWIKLRRQFPEQMREFSKNRK